MFQKKKQERARGSVPKREREREGSSSVAAHQFPFCSVILEATPQLGIALRKSGGG